MSDRREQEIWEMFYRGGGLVAIYVCVVISGLSEGTGFPSAETKLPSIVHQRMSISDQLGNIPPKKVWTRGSMTSNFPPCFVYKL